MSVEFEDVLQDAERCILAAKHRPLRAVEVEILRGAWAGLGYGAIAKQLSFQPGTLRGGYGFRLWQTLREVWSEPQLNKSNFRQVATQRLSQLAPPAANGPLPAPPPAAREIAGLNGLDLGQPLLGRELELDRTVAQIEAGCRLVVVSGAKGIGKTSFLAGLVKRCHSRFEAVFYQRGGDVQSLVDWYTAFSQQCPDQVAAAPPPAAEQLLGHILSLFQRHRCLVIVDETDCLMPQLGADWPFQPISADYQTLLRRVAAQSHRTCIVWAGQRQLSVELTCQPHVSQVLLAPLSAAAAQQLIETEFELAGSVADWQGLIADCGGNPRLLRATATYLREHHQRQIVPSQWQHDPKLKELLAALVSDLSEVEQTLLYLLSLQPQTAAQVQQWTLALPQPAHQIDQAIAHLQYRHLVTRQAQLCVQLPLLRRYLLGQLATVITDELQQEILDCFHRFPLLLPQAAAADITLQRQALLEPVGKALRRHCQETPQMLREKLLRLTQTLQSSSQRCTQAAGNLLNLVGYLNLPAPRVDLSQLSIRHADLSRVDLGEATLADCEFYGCCWPSGLGQHLSAAIQPQGTALVISDGSGHLHLYDLTRVREDLGGDRDDALAEALSESGQASLPRLRLAQTLAAPPPVSLQVTWGKGNLLAIAARCQLRLWELSADPVSDLPSPMEIEAACCLDGAAQADRLVLGLETGQISLYDTLWERPIAQIPAGRRPVQAVALSAKATGLAAYVQGDSHVRLWHIDPLTNTVAERSPIELDRYGSFLAMRWRERWQQQDPVLQIIESTSTATQLRQTSDRAVKLAEAAPAHAAAFSQNGAYLALSDAHAVYLYDAADPVRLLDSAAADLVGGQSLTVSNDGQRLATAALGRVTLWDRAVGDRLHLVQTLSEKPMTNCLLTGSRGMTTAQQAIAQRLGAKLSP